MPHFATSARYITALMIEQAGGSLLDFIKRFS
jgi:hypothetical protein